MADYSENTLPVEYRGTPTPLLKLSLVTTILTIITLGIYRFWARARLRRYFWSAITPGGDPMEYSGTGLEKFLGFLIAVAFLAVYLGLLQLGLFYAGLSMFSEAETDAELILQFVGQYITFFAILPLIFYAQYRGRRYILSRTRWRGLRFGVEPAAFGYIWRGMLYSFLSLITLGILTPLQTFRLEKYKIDRTWFGTAQFEQQGSWWMLYPAMLHILIGALFMIVPAVALIAGTGFDAVWNDFTVLENAPWGWAVGGLVIGNLWMMVGFVYYWIHSHRIMAKHKVLDGDIRFSSLPRTGKVIGVYTLGAIGASMIASLFGSMLVGGLGTIIAGVMNKSGSLDLGSLFTGDTMPTETQGILIAVSVAVLYLVFFMLYSAFAVVMIRQPLVEHFARETHILNAAGLDRITQRDGDEMVEAEGFADALDVGSAF